MKEPVTVKTAMPGTWITQTYEDIYQANLWCSEHEGEDGDVYSRLSKVNANFDRWLFVMADLNKIHPSYIKDYTLTFYQAGRTQVQLMIDIILKGVVHPIQGGYVFCLPYTGNQKTRYNVIFIANDDLRLEKIRLARIKIAVEEHKRGFIMGDEALLQILEMELYHY